MSIDNNYNKTEIIQNMQNHYSGMLKANATSFGTDEISKSIFKRVDTSQNWKLDSDEVVQAQTSLSSIISEIVTEFWDTVKNKFGKYSQQLEKANKNSEIQARNDKELTQGFASDKLDVGSDDTAGLNSSERVVLQNLQDAAQKIKQYAKAHPEDTKLQQIASRIDEYVANVEINEGGWFEAGIFDDQKLHINVNQLNNLDPDMMVKNLIHEMGHTLDGDLLSSPTEEYEVEKYAIETAEEILGKPLFEDKEKYLEDFQLNYSGILGGSTNYGTSSPNFDGIPINSGVTIMHDGALDVSTSDGITVIKSTDSGLNQEHRIVWINWMRMAILFQNQLHRL